MKKDNFNSPDYYLIDELLNEENLLIRSITRDWVKSNVSPIIEEAVQKDKFQYILSSPYLKLELLVLFYLKSMVGLKLIIFPMA